IVVYNDADNGVGAAAVASTAAVVDCTPPVISGVATSYVGGIKAKISFETNEPCVGAVRVGRECDALTIEAEGPLTTAHVVTVAGLMPQTDYYFVIEAADAAKNTAVDDNGGACHAFTTTDYVDYFTEPFLEMVSDLPNRSVTFIPNNSASSYRACAATTTDFYTNPAGGRRLALADDDFRRFALSAGRTVKLYGKTYDTLYIGSNGYITFGGGDTACNPELASHFSRPRVSGYFGDLYPPFSGLSAFISVRQLPDRVAVTYKDMPDFWGDVQSFQIELFYDGVIRITWLTLTRPYGIIGLSAGHGVPVDFESSDLSAYTSCSSVYGNQIGTACAGAMVKGRGVLPRDGRDLGDLVVMGLAVVAMTARKPRRGRASAYVTPRTDEECCGTP
ncbi:MAG TPA: hypothetical protein HPP83_05010, partial [Candidatus Hydrogenedentes bacterium]|nr:hypothetical protein [Candidatus Hydrogenedentota bacterium]